MIGRYKRNHFRARQNGLFCALSGRSFFCDFRVINRHQVGVAPLRISRVRVFVQRLNPSHGITIIQILERLPGRTKTRTLHKIREECGTLNIDATGSIPN